MRIVCVYREESDTAREVREWLREFQERSPAEVELLDPDTSAGEVFCRLYDVVAYPAVAVVTDDGRLLKAWQGTPLPMFDHVRGYVK